MNVKSKIRYQKCILFIAIQILLYITFVCLDLSGKSIALSNAVKFTVIIICFCYALFAKGQSKSISSSLKLAMFFTLISDLFILILDYYLYGVLTFIIVQLLYNYRISLNAVSSKNTEGEHSKKKSFRRVSRHFAGCFIIQLIIAGSVLICLTCLGVEAEALLIAALIYFTGLLLNTIRALAAAADKKADSGMRLFAAGLLLFLLCDINVGLFNLSSFVELEPELYSILYNISSILMWVFYAPSQILITLSIEKDYMRKNL